MRSPFLILLATSALAFTAACGASEEEVPEQSPVSTTAPTPTDPPVPAAPKACDPAAPAPTGTTLWRWGNVVVVVPEGSGIRVVRDFGQSPVDPADTRQVLVLELGDSKVAFDATDGQPVLQEVASADALVFADVLNGVCIERDVDENSLPWPYQPSEPRQEKAENFGLRYWTPDPATGIQVYVSCGVGPGAGGCFVGIQNGRSRLAVKGSTGEIIVSDVSPMLAPEDAEAFERWAAAVERVIP